MRPRRLVLAPVPAGTTTTRFVTAVTSNGIKASAAPCVGAPTGRSPPNPWSSVTLVEGEIFFWSELFVISLKVEGYISSRFISLSFL